MSPVESAAKFTHWEKKESASLLWEKWSSVNFYILVELSPDSKAVENRPVFTPGSLIISKPLRLQLRETWRRAFTWPQWEEARKVQPKTHQNFSKLSISSPHQLFLTNLPLKSKATLRNFLRGKMFLSVHVFSYPPFSLYNKILYLLCSTEPRRQCEIWSCAFRNTLRTQSWIALSHAFCGCLIITFLSVSEGDPTQVSYRKWNHTDLSYFIFSVFGQHSNGEMMSLCCISIELILLAWLSFKAHEMISKTKLQ